MNKNIEVGLCFQEFLLENYGLDVITALDSPKWEMYLKKFKTYLKKKV